MDDEDLFHASDLSQISMLKDFDSQIFEHMSQNLVNVDDATSIPSSLDPSGKYPSVEQFCNGSASFLVVMANTEGSGFVFSQKLAKLFLKIDSVCSFEARCTVPVGDRYCVRAMLVSLVPESQHEPIVRCRNHQAKDEGTDCQPIAEHVVRCKNEQHEYVGNGVGSFYEDRCAVRVPLDTDGVGARLTLQFVCQNTCFSAGLRKTGLVFTLEDSSGQVWGRQVVPIKICTNFRRDMLNEEKAQIVQNAPNALATSGKRLVGRPRKRRVGDDAGAGPSGRAGRWKREVKLEPHEVTLKMPSLQMAKRVLESAIGIISASVLRVDEDEVKSELIAYVNRLREQRQSLSISNSQCSVDSVLL